MSATCLAMVLVMQGVLHAAMARAFNKSSPNAVDVAK